MLGPKRRPHWLFLVAGVAVPLGTYVWGRSHAPPTGQRVDVLPSEQEQRLVALERTVRRLDTSTNSGSPRDDGGKARVVTYHDAEPQGGDAEPAPPAQEALDPDEERRALRAGRIEFWDGLSDRVDTEPFDPAWRRETEPTITRVLSQRLGPQAHVDEVVCGSSTCRVKLSHPEWPRIPDDEFFDFTMNRESLETMEIQVDSRDEGATVLYFLRKDAAPGEREL
jgi:hypothetical protein